MNRLLVLLILLITLLVGNSSQVFADHSLREIERYCEVDRDGDEGELDCRSRVSDRRSLERKCGPPPKKWSTVIVSKRRIRNGEQTSQTRRNSDEVAAG